MFRKTNSFIAMGIVAMLAMVSVAMLCTDNTSAFGDPYGEPTDINIAPGMTYTYTPTFPAELTVTVSIIEQIYNGDDVTWASMSSGTLTVNIPTSANPGDILSVVLKANSTNPDQEIYIPINFYIVSNLEASGSQANIVIGSDVSMTPSVSGMGTFTWAVTSGETLPAGLSLNTATGQVTGTPTTLGTNTIRLTATSSYGESVDLVVTFQVVPQLVATNSPTAGAIAYVVG